MTVVTCEFDASAVEFKNQRASRRAVSLSKDRRKYEKQSSVCRAVPCAVSLSKVSAVPVGSDFAKPHRGARAATRTCLANGAVSGSSDMPQISMGRAGSSWVRVRKPSVCSARSQQSRSIEELKMDEYFIAPALKSWQDCGDAPVAPLQVSSNPSPILFQTDLGDQKAFPALALTEAAGAAEVLQGAWAAAVEKEEKYVLLIEELTPEKPPQPIAKEAEDERLKPEVMPQLAPQKHEAADELAEDWIVVTSDDANKAAVSFGQVGGASFDGQHPRNAFGKKPASKRVMSEADPAEAGYGFDWSQPGMPDGLLRRIIRGSVNPAHHGVHSENKMVPLPGHIMLAQNIGSSKREKSAPTTPRSHSKPRTMRPSSRGR